MVGGVAGWVSDFEVGFYAYDYLHENAENKEDDSPFFAVLSVIPPHRPNDAPAEYMRNHNPGDIKLRKNVPEVPYIERKTRREIAAYYSQIENLDYNVGRIIEELKTNGLIWNTHIIFFSDHGDMQGSHGMINKTNPYEESVRIPFIIGGAGYSYSPLKTGYCDELVNHVDIAPTTLGLCGIDTPSWMEGNDFLGFRISTRDIIKTPNSMYLQSVIPSGHHNTIEFAWRGIVTKDGWKYACFDNMHWLMFNLNNDSYEQVNLAHNPKYAKKRNELLEQLVLWGKKTNDVFNFPQISEIQFEEQKNELLRK